MVMLVVIGLLTVSCTLAEIHVIIDVGDGISDTINETTKDSASLSLIKK